MGKRSGGGFFAKRQQQQQQVQAAAQQQEAQAGLLADAAFDKTVADTPVERLGEELIQPQPTQAPITELERGPSPEQLSPAELSVAPQPVSYTHLTLPTICSV